MTTKTENQRRIAMTPMTINIETTNENIRELTTNEMHAVQSGSLIGSLIKAINEAAVAAAVAALTW
jgi:hypothetical protein